MEDLLTTVMFHRYSRRVAEVLGGGGRGTSLLCYANDFLSVSL